MVYNFVSSFSFREAWMTGLRERQKAGRRRDILGAASLLFTLGLLAGLAKTGTERPVV